MLVQISRIEVRIEELLFDLLLLNVVNMSFEWYKNDDEYEMNEYKVVNGIGRYWNSDSGKWVGNKIKYDIVEKYIRFEFSVYDDSERLRGLS